MFLLRSIVGFAKTLHDRMVLKMFEKKLRHTATCCICGSK